MNKILYAYLITCMTSFIALADDDIIKVDRETSFRKSIANFGKVDQKVVSGVKKLGLFRKKSLP